ncbi:NlpC/P60 family putative phage cell wall peptidase [Litorimonas taeanensis]|uniref:NlpC/P60 family putative phage cell wall peptidase n=1 Tax=Litorimonas taeanensis TaxID=568099 RepID=A0A420WIR2_9PROT|nr:NlpC/P60 family protein [Litorimonas taeanensis]RKQ70914.1 NlpC/P60 family putative phage cell wall peptidase [Litorimonas taeanensis]
MTALRARVISETRLWLDTPYQHQASERGAGSDCLGLIRGVYRSLYGSEPIAVPPYTPDWAERSGKETLLEAAKIYLKEIPLHRTQPGDVLIFRMHPGALCKHMAILTSPNMITHAYWGRAVVDSYFVPYWNRRWVSSFAFPEIEKKTL